MVALNSEGRAGVKQVNRGGASLAECSLSGRGRESTGPDGSRSEAGKAVREALQ